MSRNLQQGMDGFRKCEGPGRPPGSRSPRSLPCGRGCWRKLSGCGRPEECAKRGSYTSLLAWEKALKAEPAPAEKNTVWR